MKHLIASLIITLATVTAFAGPGSGNGDDGSLMISKIQAEQGLDDFHTLLYMFDHGAAFQAGDLANWTGGMVFTDSPTPSSFPNTDEHLAFSRVDRGPLAPIWSICLSKDYIGSTCFDRTQDTATNWIAARHGSLVSHDQLAPWGDYEIEHRTSGQYLIEVKHALTGGTKKGQCIENRNTHPVDGICSVGYYEQKN